MGGSLGRHRSLSRAAPLRAERGGGGFSLVELMVVLVVLTVTMGMFSSTLLSTARQGSHKRETAIAAEAVRRQIEVMRSRPLAELFALYDGDPANDPGGPGTAPGAGFAVPGLALREGDADGLAGEIVFPALAGELREDVEDDSLGMPRDLNADGEIDALDHAGDYLILPVLIRVQWQGPSGPREFRMYTMLTSV
ncbi:MAG TPA: prepilin-type N-terminal cleavage/methylation domain-containing protein [Candidatus Limnocylindrales bacterium]|nr:prepilin-type N-terminal cleavage/methylation domain-containing protein [Candidatus Limnocylindrales bacterium]